MQLRCHVRELKLKLDLKTKEVEIGIEEKTKELRCYMRLITSYSSFFIKDQMTRIFF